MRLIGLMMIRDEQDMLAEALGNHTKFCDAVLVLDGSEGEAQIRSEAICRSFPQVAGYWRDCETGYDAPLRDGARQFLLERGRERFGVENWYVVLHGDEIWGEDPRSRLDAAAGDGCGLAVHLYHFFPYVSQQDEWDFQEGVSSIEALSKWYMRPPVDEDRLFCDRGDHDYAVERHSRVVPGGLETVQSGLCVKQYNYRSPEQAHKRAVARRDARWQENHYQHLIGGPENFFVETLASKDWQWASLVPPGQGEATNVMRDPLPSLGEPLHPDAAKRGAAGWWQRLFGTA